MICEIQRCFVKTSLQGNRYYHMVCEIQRCFVKTSLQGNRYYKGIVSTRESSLQGNRYYHMENIDVEGEEVTHSVELLKIFSDGMIGVFLKIKT